MPEGQIQVIGSGSWVSCSGSGLLCKFLAGKAALFRLAMVLKKESDIPGEKRNPTQIKGNKIFFIKCCK
jgi:hypothetical protein